MLLVAIAIVASFGGAFTLWACGRAGLGSLPAMWLCLLVFALLLQVLPTLPGVHP
jgi:hypothetical protein